MMPITVAEIDEFEEAEKVRQEEERETSLRFYLAPLLSDQELSLLAATRKLHQKDGTCPERN
jgi:hypothetical protein